MDSLQELAGEGTSLDGVCIKLEVEEEDDSYNNMDFLELAACSVQTNQEPIEFDSTSAMLDKNTGLMVCLHCLEDFETNLIYDHMVNAHNYRRILFKCHICQTSFRERQILNAHREHCKRPVKKKVRKSFHQIMKDVDELVTSCLDDSATASCPVCLLDIPIISLKDHVVVEHTKPEPSLDCERCHRTFKTKLTLKEHIKLVHMAVEDSVECAQCGQKFSSIKYLGNHKRNVHPTGNKEHKCEICGKSFKSHLCLHQHTKYVHPPESASVQCPECPKIFKARLNLQQHLRVSHRNRV